MESGLSKAFCGVYNSSREIVKNNQRHLFCNMLDLLARTTKTTGDKYLNLDEFVLFWTTDILPLIFDEDKEIQRSAIAAMEAVANTLNFKILHTCSRWNDIKAKIVQNYSKEIYKYRESSNSCWHRIWCILIRILDKEIIKGASTINAFLSIVELGFRSPDYNVRAEAFKCWKVLIEIFAKNGEICSPKRIRLICIPLKSSHSKTTQAAAVKFKVWWYLITKLNTHIEQHVEGILEPFLAFCYGSVNRNSSCVTDFKEMTILCLTSLLGGSTKLVERRMEYFKIESLREPLINKNIMHKFWSSMILYSIEAINDCGGIISGGTELSELLLHNILEHVISIENIEATHLLFDKLIACDADLVAPGIHKYVANQNFPQWMTSIVNDDFLGRFLSALCRFVTANEKTCNDSVEQIIKSIFLLNSDRFGNVLDLFLNGTIAKLIRPIGDVIEAWKIITKCLINNFGLCHQSDCNASLKSVINKWIVWPLKVFSEMLKCDMQVFDTEFDNLLQMSIESLNNAVDKPTFLKELSLLLQKIYKLNSPHSKLKPYLACFIKMLVMSLHIEPDEELMSVTFDILKFNLSADFEKDKFELCMKCLKCVVTFLGQNGIDKHFGDIKDAWSQVINIKRNNDIEQVSFDEYRKQFLDDVKKVASKAQYNKIKNYLENDDLFVIIPAVWSLNPEKLTERQKEKFFQKSDIPALYNDMSQSQDAFLKPWTPTKLVIAKGHVEEIVIGEQREALNVTEQMRTSNTIESLSDKKEANLTITNLFLKEDTHNNQYIDNTDILKNNSETTIIKNIINAPNKIQEEDNFINCRALRPKILSLEAEEIPNSNIDEYVEPEEVIVLKDTSSPPDRKQTNNSTSPVLKPKTTHLTGRGAQLINMIRNKKHEHFNKHIETSTPTQRMEPSREKTDSYLNWSGVDSDSKPSPMNLLVFSKTLPSPCASPSASILKRKHLNDSIDEYESQAFKRKRVSFHDPPVSVTKEYLKDEENKHNSKRCLVLDQELKGTTKHLLRRSLKIDGEHLSNVSGLNGTPIKRVKCNVINCEESVPKNVGEVDPTMSKRSFPFLFRTEADVLNYVVNQFSIEDVCGKYFSDDKLEKAGSNLSKFISNFMNASSKFKSTMLEILSEKHPKEFLDYAIQENLSSVVCDRLNSNAVVDYVCNKSQTNIACRTRLLQEMQDILNHDKFADEKWEFIKKSITSKSMSDQQLLNLIELLFESKRKHQRAVSESAIDSSSTL